MTDIKLVEISNNNKLAKRCNKKKAKYLGVLKIEEEDVDELIEEIRKRDQFDEELDINNKETVTYTNEVEDTDWSILAHGLT